MLSTIASILLGSATLLSAIPMPPTPTATGPANACSTTQKFVRSVGCCNLCPSGYGVSSSCRLLEDNTLQQTICEACKTKPGNTERQLHMKACPLQSTPSSEKVSKCREGWFWEEKSGKCKQCTACPAGYERVKGCSGRSLRVDVECRRCPNGTYSARDLYDGWERCQSCSLCVSDEELVQPCTAFSNTQCRKSNKLPYKLFLSTNDNMLNTRISSSNAPAVRAQQGNNMIYLYCSVMGAIVIALIIYVIVQNLRKRSHGPSGGSAGSKHNSGTHRLLDVPGGSGDFTTTPLFTAVPCWNKAAPPTAIWDKLGCHNQPQRQLMAGCDQTVTTYPVLNNGAHMLTEPGSALEKDRASGTILGAATQLTNSTRFNELPTLKRRQIETLIGADEQSWRAIAKNLGYNSSQLDSYANRTKRNQSSVHLILADWSKADSATLGVLIRALKKSGRPDIVPAIRGGHIGPMPHFPVNII